MRVVVADAGRRLVERGGIGARRPQDVRRPQRGGDARRISQLSPVRAVPASENFTSTPSSSARKPSAPDWVTGASGESHSRTRGCSEAAGNASEPVWIVAGSMVTTLPFTAAICA